jgi:HD-like signal output (HDOD) protein
MPAAARIGAELDQHRRKGPLREIRIPPCPERLAQLQAAMACAEPDLNAVARIAGADVAMSATLIRQANGAAFAAMQPAQTVGQAMTRLGLRATGTLMTGFITRHAIPVNHPQLKRFWERSAMRAQAMSALAERIPGLDADVAYTCGLFAHVGMPVLLQSVRGYGGTLVEASARIDRPFVATENANHQTDHAVVGALVARAWNLAPSVMAAIRLHHDLDSIGCGDIEPEVHTLVAACLTGEHIARRLEGLKPEGEWTRFGEPALGWLGLQPTDVEDCEAELQQASAAEV